MIDLYEYHLGEIRKMRRAHDAARRRFDRIIEAALDDHVPQVRVAEAAGLSQSTISARYIQPRRKPRVA